MEERTQRIVNDLTERFTFMQDWCRATRPRRISAEVPRQNVIKVIAYSKDILHFGSLCTITGLDNGGNYDLIYHLADEQGIVLNIKISAPKTDPVFDTVTEYYHGATLYEIEACNLFGLIIKGIPEDIRYPLPDDWPNGQYPLRKDWEQTPGSGPEGVC